jgi:hypothetical protein
MDIHATALAGTVVIGAIIIAFIVEVARGYDVRRNRGSARSAAWRT